MRSLPREAGRDPRPGCLASCRRRPRKVPPGAESWPGAPFLWAGEQRLFAGVSLTLHSYLESHTVEQVPALISERVWAPISQCTAARAGPTQKHGARPGASAEWRPSLPLSPSLPRTAALSAVWSLAGRRGAEARIWLRTPSSGSQGAQGGP